MTDAANNGADSADLPYELVDERILLARYVDNRPDQALEAELTSRFMPLALSLAGRYSGRSEQDEDLRQVASLGLVKALRRYDPEVGRHFPAFAAPTILGELKRHFRDHSWRLRIPRSIQENSIAVDRATAELVEANGASPTVNEVAKHAGISVEDVIEALEARESQRSMSLDMPVYADEPQATTLGESMGSEDLGFDAVDAQLSVERCAGITERERQAIELRFVHDLNQYEIAERIGVSQMQVSRILRQGLAKMLEAVQGDESPDGRRSLQETKADPRFPNGRARLRSSQKSPSPA